MYTKKVSLYWKLDFQGYHKKCIQIKSHLLEVEKNLEYSQWEVNHSYNFTFIHLVNCIAHEAVAYPFLVKIKV